MMVRFDRWLFELINARLGGFELDLMDEIFVDLSALGAWTIGIVLLAVLSGERREVFGRHILALLLASLVLFPAYGGMKVGLKRDRPARVMGVEGGVADVKPRFLERRTPKRNAFPSGHTAFAFFCMVYAGLYRKAWLPWGVGVAGLIGVARVYVGAHWPLDCVAGALMGWGGGWLAWRVFRRLDRERGQAKS